MSLSTVSCIVKQEVFPDMEETLDGVTDEDAAGGGVYGVVLMLVAAARLALSSR